VGNSNKSFESKTDDTEKIHFDTLEFIKSRRAIGKYGFTSTDILKKEHVKFVSSGELRIIRNEIFARYGYIFESKDLNNYFLEFEWYEPRFDNVTAFLNEIERKNINIIKDLEKSASNISDSAQFQEFLRTIKNQRIGNYPVLSHKFGERTLEFYNYPYGLHTEAVDLLFNEISDNYYVLYLKTLACDQCDFEYEIRAFNVKGELLATYPIGTTYGDFNFNEKEDTFSIRYIKQKYNTPPSDTISLTYVLTSINGDEKLIKANKRVDGR